MNRLTTTLRLALMAAVCLFTLTRPVTARAQDGGNEYQRKAALICTFLRSVTWPARKFAQPESPLVVGVYGTDSISDFLREAIQGRQFQERAVVVKHINAKQELAACHILFVSRSERDRLGPVLGEVRREGVLTVGESDNFLKAGGVVNLISVGGVIRYQIKGDAAKREHLGVSGKLLQFALPPDFNPNDPRFTQTRPD